MSLLLTLLAATPVPSGAASAIPSALPSTLPSAAPSASASPSPSTFGAGIITFSFLLSVLVWVPFIAAIVVSLLPAPRRRNQRYLLGFAFWINVGLLVLTVIAYSQFSVYGSGVQFEENLPWLPQLGIHYHLGVDGAGMGMLVLSGLVGVGGCLAAYNLRDRGREFFTLLLLTQWAVNGAIASQDLLLLLLFWTLATIPLSLLVGGWSGQRRWRAAGRFAAYWLLGAAALLGGGLLLVAASGGTSFELSQLQQATLPWQSQLVVATLVLLAAATRLPLAPLHGWVRETLSEAHPAVAVVLAGAAARVGGSVLLELFVAPDHWAAKVLAPVVAVLAGLTVVWGALGAFGSRDLRRVTTYLALIPGGVTALGVAGLSPLSLNGAAVMLFAGGLSAALMVGIGATFADHAQGRNLALVAGLATRLPRLSWLLVAATVAILAIPFMATFPATAMVVLGAMHNQPIATLVVLAGLVVAAAAAAWLLHRVLFGAPSPESPTVRDASLSEVWYLGLLIGALLWVGLLPSGPKLASISIFDPGFVNVVSQAASGLSSPYVPQAPPALSTPTPTASPSPSPSPSAGPSASPTPGPSPSPS